MRIPCFYKKSGNKVDFFVEIMLKPLFFQLHKWIRFRKLGLFPESEKHGEPKNKVLMKVQKVRKVSWVPLTIFWIYHKLVFAIKYWKSTRYAVKDLIFNLGCKIIWKIIICLEFLEAEIWLRGGLNVFWMQHPLVKISILLNGKYWSEQSASAALRCCIVHYFWDYFFFLFLSSVPHNFLPEF